MTLVAPQLRPPLVRPLGPVNRGNRRWGTLSTNVLARDCAASQSGGASRRRAKQMRRGAVGGQQPAASGQQSARCEHQPATHADSDSSGNRFSAAEERPGVLIALGRLVCHWIASRGGLKTLLLGGAGPVPNATYAAATGVALGWPAVSLEQLSGVFSNYVFQVGFVAWFIAQSGKIFTYRARKGKWRLKACLDSGGMPSSHSSLCMGVTTAVGVLHGFASSLFAMSLAFSLIVMYDAAGVRRHAGKQAEVLNMVIKDLWAGNPVSGREIRAAVSGGSSASMSQSEMEAERDFALRSLASGSFDDVEFLFMTEEQRLNHKKYKLERMDQLKNIATHRQDDDHPKLKEVLGHTPIQVAAGGALGVIVGLLLHPV